MPISRSWVDKEVEGLTGRDRAIARFALVLAKAPYQVDEALVGEILREDREETRFIRVLAWASFSAARRIAKRIADTVESKMAKETKFKDRIGRPRPPSWWKFVFSISMPEKLLPQLPYNERSQSDQGLGIPHQAAFNNLTCFRSFHPSIRRMWI
jgi:hypothetical protein